MKEFLIATIASAIIGAVVGTAWACAFIWAMGDPIF